MLHALNSLGEHNYKNHTFIPFVIRLHASGIFFYFCSLCYYAGQMRLQFSVDSQPHIHHTTSPSLAVAWERMRKGKKRQHSYGNIQLSLSHKKKTEQIHSPQPADR